MFDRYQARGLMEKDMSVSENETRRWATLDILVEAYKSSDGIPQYERVRFIAWGYKADAIIKSFAEGSFRKGHYVELSGRFRSGADPRGGRSIWFNLQDYADLTSELGVPVVSVPVLKQEERQIQAAEDPQNNHSAKVGVEACVSTGSSPVSAASSTCESVTERTDRSDPAADMDDIDLRNAAIMEDCKTEEEYPDFEEPAKFSAGSSVFPHLCARHREEKPGSNDQSPAGGGHAFKPRKKLGCR